MNGNNATILLKKNNDLHPKAKDYLPLQTASYVRPGQAHSSEPTE